MNKLALLRKEIEAHGLDGYVVPMADEFLSEYVPPYARRLEWLTGFTGSAGEVVVLKEQAAFFTDGRYAIQAREQVGDRFKIFDIYKSSPLKFINSILGDNSPNPSRIGIDSWLISYGRLKRSYNNSLVLCDNLIDKIWQDKPSASKSSIFAHDIKYSGQSTKDKINSINMDADALLITDPESVNWLLNIRGSDLEHTPIALCRAILHKSGVVDLYINPEKFDKNITIANTHVHDEAVFLSDIREKLAEKKVMIAESSNAVFFDYLEKIGAKLNICEDPCVLPKACKNPVEIEGMRAAHRRDGVALCRFLAWLDENVGKNEITEITAAEKLDNMRAEGDLFRGASFPTISGYGSNGAIVHYHATGKSNKKFESGSLYLVDSGGQYYDGTTDVTRTIAIGEPTALQKLHFTLVLKGHIALARARFPRGTTGAHLDALARQYLWQYGLDFDHGTGHGVGCFLNVHEGPQGISKAAGKVALQPGMVLSNEPGYYLEGEYGIRIENLVVVTECEDAADNSDNNSDDRQFYQFETITLAPIDLRLIDTNLLNNDEINWLNNYHKQVRGTLSPSINSVVQQWLKHATTPGFARA